MIDDTWYHRPDDMAAERTSAAGVVVRIEAGNLLVALVREIDTKGWTLDGYVLPKGGVREGESVEAAALREIEEEAGLTEPAKLMDLAVLERQDANREYWSINHYALYLTGQVSGEILDKDHHFDFGWFPIESIPPLFWPDESRMIETRRKQIYDAVIAAQNPAPKTTGTAQAEFWADGP